MVDLTDDQQIAFDFLNRKSNELTLEKRRELWKTNITKNRKYFIKGNPELPGMVIFIIGAGPSLDHNINELKKIPKNSRGYIMACDAALPTLFENDIIPDYCISIDGDSRMWKMVNDSPKVDTSKVTLLCTIATSPNLVKNWKGPIYFFMNRTNTTELDSEMFFLSRLHKATKDIKTGDEISSEDVEMVFGGIKPELTPGGNVTASGFQFAYFKFGAKKVIIVGLDLSWKVDEHFYAGKANEKMGNERVNSEMIQLHKDIYKRDVFTNMSFFNFKKIHEDYAKIYKDVMVNSTEGGILGIDENGEKIDEIEFLTLKQSIEKYVL